MAKQGLVQVYTGDGKGKTTAALGLALRALGHGWRVEIIQFMKSGYMYGEVQALEHFANCTLRQFGRDVLVDLNNPDPQDAAFARQGLAEAAAIVRGDSCDLLILDELNVVLAANLLSVEDALDLLRHRPPAMEIVITGRYAPQLILDNAQLVTEMKMLKHPFEQGQGARPGIEF